MQPTSQSALPSSTPVRRPAWHRIYYLLALFDICAVAVSLYVNHQIVRIYLESVDADRTWVEIGHAVSELGELAATINAPGNDVFQSRDIPSERAKLDRSYHEFRDRSASLTRSLTAQERSDQIDTMVGDLRSVRSSTGQMVRDAELTLSFLEANRLYRATKYMASMDRRYWAVTSTLVRLRARIVALQKEHFQREIAAASLLQKSEYLIAGLITLMIVAATVYGRVVAHQVSLATQLRETYRAELEQRVAERTADLLAPNEARAELLKLLISAEEEERRRLARELHDGIGQSLTYLVVALGRLEQREAAGARSDATQLRDIASQALEEARRIARGLRPSVLDDIGLAPALERLISDFEATQSLAVDLDNRITAETRLPEAIETAIYRIIQEALTNIAKHASATRVTLVLERTDGCVNVAIHDDGHGFDVPAASSVAQKGGSVGLASIRERVSILGGVSQIISRPQYGTTVRFSIPIPATETNAQAKLPPEADAMNTVAHLRQDQS